MTRSQARRPSLLFFTDSYPDDLALEQTFIAPQLPFLMEAFERVFLIPSHLGGSRLPIPSEVTIDEGLAQRLNDRRRTLARGLRSRLLLEDVGGRRGIAWRKDAVRRLLAMAGRAEITKSWIDELLARHDLDPIDCVGYSFWWDHAAVGLALARTRHPTLLAVARANGVDLFEERHTPPYLPLRQFSLANLDRIFLASEAGLRYVASRHPELVDQCEVARLGTSDPGFSSRRSGDRAFAAVSCSGLVPVKRVDLIARAIGHAATARPDVSFTWHHFGGGGQVESVEREVGRLPPNAEAILHGQRPPEEIVSFYRDHEVDVFLNASSSEGGSPVAIMEAASCGIPVVATAVGGNPEIVSERNGVLLSEHGAPDEFGAAVLSILDRPESADRMRLESRCVWEERFSAETNYLHFARTLAEMRSRRTHGES